MGRATSRRRAIDMGQVREAIEAAERRTSAEIVVAIAPFFIGRVEVAARRAFVRLGVAAVRADHGVLVFVVPARHQVIVLADEITDAQIDRAAWDDVALRIAGAFGRGHGTVGLVDAIERIARVLGGPFPPQRRQVLELAIEP